MASQDFSIYQGDSRNLVVTITDDSNVAVPLTGGTVKWVLVSGTQTLLYKDTGENGGITITNAAAGQCTIALKEEDTTSLTPGTYTQEARLIDNNNNSSIIFTGIITVNKSHV